MSLQVRFTPTFTCIKLLSSSFRFFEYTTLLKQFHHAIYFYWIIIPTTCISPSSNSDFELVLKLMSSSAACYKEEFKVWRMIDHVSKLVPIGEKTAIFNVNRRKNHRKSHTESAKASPKEVQKGRESRFDADSAELNGATFSGTRNIPMFHFTATFFNDHIPQNFKSLVLQCFIPLFCTWWKSSDNKIYPVAV